MRSRISTSVSTSRPSMSKMTARIGRGKGMAPVTGTGGAGEVNFRLSG
jgi:hypothetical protein